MDEGFAPAPGLDEGGRARRVGDGFWTTAQALLAEADGSVWLLSRSYSSPDFSQATVRLEHYDVEGSLLETSRLAAPDLDGLVLHGSGALTAFQNWCGALETDVCFHHDALTGELRHGVWPASARVVTQYRLDEAGNVLGSADVESAERRVVSAVAAGEGGLFAVTRHGSHVVSRLDEHDSVLWSTEFLPALIPPELPPDAPLDDLLKAARLVWQAPTEPATVDGALVVAAAVTRGTLAALALSRGMEFGLPDDPRCPDILVAQFSDVDGTARYFVLPTPDCESLPVLAVVGEKAIVASTVEVPKTPEPNDTFQYDIGLTILDLRTGEAVSRRLALGDEDDRVYAIAPCGADRVCLAGMTGARSVNTGSTVTYGDGFVLPVSLAGEPELPWKLTSPRHSEILRLVPRPGGLVFFATVNGAITHTADQDPWLGFNEGLLGTIDGP